MREAFFFTFFRPQCQFVVTYLKVGAEFSHWIRVSEKQNTRETMKEFHDLGGGKERFEKANLDNSCGRNAKRVHCDAHFSFFQYSHCAYIHPIRATKESYISFARRCNEILFSSKWLSDHF